MISIKKTHICANSERNAWGKPADIVEIAANNRLVIARVIIGGKTLAVFDNMFDTWDLIEDGPETLEDIKQSGLCFAHKSGAIVSNSLEKSTAIGGE